MAFQFLRPLVVRQANITSRTPFHVTTGLALLIRAKSTTVLEEDDALPFVQNATHRIDQFHAKVPFDLLALLRSEHIHHL